MSKFSPSTAPKPWHLHLCTVAEQLLSKPTVFGPNLSDVDIGHGTDPNLSPKFQLRIFNAKNFDEIRGFHEGTGTPEKKHPGKPRKVPFLLGNWIAGFRGFKWMEINSNCFSRIGHLYFLTRAAESSESFWKWKSPCIIKASLFIVSLTLRMARLKVCQATTSERHCKRGFSGCQTLIAQPQKRGRFSEASLLMSVSLTKRFFGSFRGVFRCHF